ncbi:hypothetical protein MATL_G00174750 [Megalops atlanticus]|uniref:Immunoglobulin subtype domain-containing protein n=1 Tax=Megalops atlanticus TaxID=7932 RepID=A0A9D3T8G4_MEGAT|nr:hypothetical protein MATL_G00174750 [Megalops atlanticus]
MWTPRLCVALAVFSNVYVIQTEGIVEPAVLVTAKLGDDSCVYTLPKRNLSPSDSGTYYCAVATCGEILFGNGTKMDLEGSEERKAFFQLLVSCLAGALVLCLIIIGVLIGVIRTGKCCEHCKGVGFQQNSQAVPSDDLSIEQNHDMEPLNYAALNFTNRKSKTGRKVREMESDTLYSNMRLKDCDGNFR